MRHSRSIVVALFLVLSVTVAGTGTAAAEKGGGRGKPDTTSDTCRGKKCTEPEPVPEPAPEPEPEPEPAPEPEPTPEPTPATDDVPPFLEVIDPEHASTFSTGTLSARGTASDETELESVWVQVDEGVSTMALGTESWIHEIADLSPGQHIVRVMAVDGSRNVTAVEVGVEVATPAWTPEDPDDFVLHDPGATGSLHPVLRTSLLARGDLTGVLYVDDAFAPSIAFRDDAGAVSFLRLPSTSRAGWVYAATAWPTDQDLFIAGGNGPIHVRHYRLDWSAGRPVAATLVSDEVFGDTDSRPGDMIALADGSIVHTWHQQGATGPQGQWVASRPVDGPWTTAGPLKYIVSRSSDQVLAQHPVDGSVWMFTSPDAWGSIGAARLTVDAAGPHVTMTDGSFISRQEYGDFGPDPEDPHLAVASDPTTGSIALAYQSGDRVWFPSSEASSGFVVGSRVAVARIAADGTPSFLMTPDRAERVLPIALRVIGGTTHLAYHVVSEADPRPDRIQLSSHDGIDWAEPELVGGASTPVVTRNGSDMSIYQDGTTIRLLRRR